MTKEEFNKLKRGDIVTSRGSGLSYQILDACKDGAKIAARVISIEDPSSWNLTYVTTEYIAPTTR